ncbi:nucleotidyltransferase domain-containing protein [Archangium violaceum]|uniref:nucleotidyltransferase domain-containing protein n=1 Tax=Archangium violaceum TaxID=83451 RepID=UPI00194F1802|nr:nucleotidyltransferase domain-containing protein [Archangium violaceum]QRO00681.1 nucleotidyltransferase domain-containing protein [Archangium violaceum]
MSDGPLHHLAQRIRAWAERAPAVRALFWYGGYGYGQLLPGSDLDMAVLLSPGADAARVSNALVDALSTQGDPVELVVFTPEEQRLTAWMSEALTKLDLVFGRTAGELAWLADAGDVPPPRLTSAWPVQDPEVLDLLHRASRPIAESDAELRRERSEREIDKFLIAFEACSAAHAKGDAYAFYFQYNLALGRLARLVQLTRVGHRYLYLPRNLLTGALEADERASFRLLSGTLQLSEAHDRERALAKAFLETLEEVRAVLGARRESAGLARFLERILRRDQPPGEGHP